ncbi:MULTISPECIES: nucleotidyltransferase family protein [unclassified Thioalkalivibrio]|uniref:nucleotidyltransferase family protein n=1 Tax=unclassified Thioalkalivibrio TaxID=2621013 RepID=UPI0003658EB4|nr:MULTISPECIES: nucleotidyltransferase domain-containing protein [unclassified Thioalkalivibrio]
MTAAASATKFGLPADVVTRLCAVFAGWPEITGVWLYGSRAKGTWRKASDIDLCLQADSLGVRDLLRIEGEIDDLLLPWKVDLSLWHQIEEEDLRGHIRRVAVELCPSDIPAG